MSVSLVALYRKPTDEAAFLSHYDNVHTPLVQKTPNLQNITVSRVTGSPMGEPAYFMIAQMQFADRAAFDEAMASQENRAAGKDLMSFAREIVTLLVVEQP
jgi:uncharacterized protein (TIGR02118 family)